MSAESCPLLFHGGWGTARLAVEAVAEGATGESLLMFGVGALGMLCA